MQFLTPVSSKTNVCAVCWLVQQSEVFTLRWTKFLAPLRPLMSPTAFVCEKPHQNAFDLTTKDLSSRRFLANFDVSGSLRLETDAAQSRGLRMALLQQDQDGSWWLLQCASRHFTSTEARYSATEIELLAVVWAPKKAHLFMAGTHVELTVDHKPLVSIIDSKTLNELSMPWIVLIQSLL